MLTLTKELPQLLYIIKPRHACTRRVFYFVCHSVIQQGITKIANFYPFKWVLNQKLSPFNSIFSHKGEKTRNFPNNW